MAYGTSPAARLVRLGRRSGSAARLHADAVEKLQEAALLAFWGWGCGMPERAPAADDQCAAPTDERVVPLNA
jgi:hypothetical protein